MKSKRKCIAFFTAVACLFSGISAFNAYMPTAFAEENEQTQAQTTADFPCEITAVAERDNHTYYGAESYTLYTEEEAAAAGVPNGFEGNVIKVNPLASSLNCGVLLDFSSAEIPIALVQELSFRVYISQNEANTGIYPQIRIPRPYEVGTAWVYQDPNNATPTGEWTTVTVNNKASMQYLKNEAGNLGKFELCVRTSGAVDYYIDEFSYTLAENDGVAPVISGVSDSVKLYYGETLNLTPTAQDEQENRRIDVQQTWSEGAWEEDGKLALGEHTLTLTATDYYGNKAEKQVQVEVRVFETDTTPPVIQVPDVIYAETGCVFLFNMSVTDNEEVANSSFAWSDGALDSKGGLAEGTHTLTITAEDTSGNKTEKTVTVIVTDEGVGPGEIIDEEVLMGGKDSGSDTDSMDSSGEYTGEEGSNTASDSDTDSVSSSDTDADSDTDTGSGETSDTVGDTATDSENSSEADSSSATESGSSDISDDTQSENSSTNSGSGADSQSGKEESGCGSAIGLGALSGAAFIGAALALKKKKEN